MELTTKTAQRLKELMFYVNVGDEYLVDEIISFKNELKDRLNEHYEKYSLRCKCSFCKWSDNLIQEIESVEKQ